MNKYLVLCLLVTACGSEDRPTPQHRILDNTIEPNKVVWDISEMPVCLNPCDVLMVRDVGRFYCEGSNQWRPLVTVINCQMN